MFASEIPFELHITTSPLLVKETDDFVSFCNTHEAKPLLIELARGEYIAQPMMNKVILVHSLDEALLTATELSEQLNINNWKVQRLKIEIPAYHAEQWNVSEHAFEPYFEWHGKIKGDATPELLGFCQHHRAHLSLNALKKEDNYRFITLRESGSKALFQQRVDRISGSLKAAGWPLIKEVSEFCVYDNNVYLDKGWLPV
jgi:glycyl-tRNA synthetase beta subunit